MYGARDVVTRLETMGRSSAQETATDSGEIVSIDARRSASQ